MNALFSFGEVLVLLVTFLLFFVAAVLFSYRAKKGLSNLLIGAFFLLEGLSLLDGFGFVRGFYQENLNLAFWLNALVWLQAPVLWLYTRSLIYDDFELRPKDLLHAIPTVMMLFVNIFTYHIQDQASKAMYLEHALNYKGWPIVIGYVLFALQTFVYLWLAFKEIRKYHWAIKEKYADIDRLRLSWLVFVLIAFSLIYLSGMSMNFFRLSTDTERALQPEIIGFTTLLFIFVLLVLIKALRQSQVFSGMQMDEEPLRYQAHPLADEEQLAIQDALDQIMAEKQVFLNPDLSVQMLADLLKVNSRKLSQTLNSSLGMSFFDYINSLRIQAAKEQIQSSIDEKQTIAEIMYAVGFNSKSSFNAAFKKFTGMTPSQFKKQQTN